MATAYDYQLYEADGKIYWNGRDTGADAESFEYFRFYDTYKDKDHVYRYDREAGLIGYKNIDPKSISIYSNFLADKDYLYAMDYRILRNDKVELLAVIKGYFPGCGLDKTPSSTYYLFKNSDGYWIVYSSNIVKINYLGSELDEKLKKFDVN
jgi:hypothetical protein